MIPFVLILGAYLIGSIPFGYLIGRLKGIDLFQVGSKNIGATNVSRQLGSRYGLLVFALDFLKGAGPVGVATVLQNRLEFAADSLWSWPDLLRVSVGLAAFLGHLFPIYLRLRGGKGMATGAGVVAVLVPGPCAVTALAWLAIVSTTRWVSLASIGAVVVLAITRLLGQSAPFAESSLVITLFCLIGAGAVIVKHRSNMGRLLRREENQLKESSMWYNMSRSIHALAVGLWFGSMVFFNFLAAPAIFDSFKDVVAQAPNDRTAFIPITKETDADQQKALASALAGSAVGPLFPISYAIQGICLFLAVVTAHGWYALRGIHRWRVIVLYLGIVLLLVSYPFSNHVSTLRFERFALDPAVAAHAKEQFGPMHLISLLLGFLQTIVSAVAMAMAGRIPQAK